VRYVNTHGYRTTTAPFRHEREFGRAQRPVIMRPVMFEPPPRPLDLSVGAGGDNIPIS
jgi:hypothetical protein